MGSDWSWTLVLPAGTLNAATVGKLLTLAETFGLTAHRPDGGINGFDAAPGHEGEHRVLDREQLVRGLVTGSWSTNLWIRSEVDVFLSTKPGGGSGWDFVSLTLDSCHRIRTPDARAEPFRELHRSLTDLWLAIAGETGALFGRVEDEWSLEQILSELSDPRAGTLSPPSESGPEWLSWWTYLDADAFRRLSPVLAGLDIVVHRTAGEAAVIELPGDPAVVDPVEFARLHHEYRRLGAVRTDSHRRAAGASAGTAGFRGGTASIGR